MHHDKPRKKYLFLVVVSLVAIVAITAGFISEYKASRTRDTQDYYDPSVFEKPKDLMSLFGYHTFQASPSAVLRIKLPIILYHYVENVKDPGDTIRKRLNIVPSEFEHQLKTLKEAGYQSYFVKDIPDILSGKIIMTQKAVVLTFDDGYEDFYTDALPILKKYNMKATAYIVPHFIGKHNYLTEKELSEISRSSLIEIGSHTLDHTALKGATKVLAMHEIADSRKWFTDRGIDVTTFAYPYGSFSKESEDLVKSAGYTAAVSVIYGNIQSEDNLFFLSRIRPGFLVGPHMIEYLEKMEK